jgi:hypothetical protein
VAALAARREHGRGGPGRGRRGRARRPGPDSDDCVVPSPVLSESAGESGGRRGVFAAGEFGVLLEPVTVLESGSRAGQFRCRAERVPLINGRAGPPGPDRI